MIIAYYYTYILREQNLLPVKFEHMLQILFTLKFLGVRYILITLYLRLREQFCFWLSSRQSVLSILAHVA